MGLGTKCLLTPAPDLVQGVHDRGLDFSSLRKAAPKEATTPDLARGVDQWVRPYRGIELFEIPMISIIILHLAFLPFKRMLGSNL